MKTHRPTLVVLFGGRSAEHSVSCVTAAQVLQAIDHTKYTVLPIGITKTGVWKHLTDYHHFSFSGDTLPEVTDSPGSPSVLPPVAPTGEPLREITAEGVVRELGTPDVYFPLLHGTNGEDGTVQGICALADVPCVGSGVFASAACMDKHFMKVILHAAGIPVVAWQTVTTHEYAANTAETLEKIASHGFPAFIKPARAGSSMGISRVTDSDSVQAGLEKAFAVDTKVIVEPQVHGREIECGVLGNPACGISTSSLGEIIVDASYDFYDFTAKYLDSAAVHLSCPAEVDEAMQEKVRDIARRTFLALDCADLARVDMFVTDNGEVLVNEVNTMPGFTPSSMFPRVWQASGIGYAELVDRLIELALNG